MIEDNDDDEIRHEDLPVYLKAVEISKLVEIIANLLLEDKIEIPSKDEREIYMAKSYAEHMLENSHIIMAKIAGAEGGGLYDIRMENAAIIRKCAREIYVNCTGLRMIKFPDQDYLDLLRSEIEEFRIIFAEWVKSFDVYDYVIDRWGLFNPPGVNYDDHDPDDDIPFDPDDLG